MKWSKSSFGNVVAGHRKSRLPSENTIAGENNLTFPAMKISTLVFCTSSYKNLAVFSVQKNRTSKHGVHNALKVSKSGSRWIQLKKCDAADSLPLCWDHPSCAERLMPACLEKHYYLQALSCGSLASFSARPFWNQSCISRALRL